MCGLPLVLQSVTILLQSAIGITKCDRYYKVFLFKILGSSLSNNFCNEHLYTNIQKICLNSDLYIFTISCCTRNTRTGKQNCLEYYTRTLILSSFQLYIGHMFTLLFVVEVYFTFAFLDCVRYHKGFVKSRFVILIVACRTRFALPAKCRVRLAWLTKVPVNVLYWYV